MAPLMFYGKPTPINRNKHKDARIRSIAGDYSFAGATNSVLLAGVEFIEASKEYPIVFSKASDDRYVPVALLGLRNEENLFVDEQGAWDARYIPAFVRRYPFVLARGDSEGDYSVCVDEAFSGFRASPGKQDQEGEPLFDENGENSPALQRAVEFLGEYQRQYQRVERFTARLAELDLFTELTARVELREGGKFALGGLQVVDEKKLLELGDEEALKLFRQGELAWVYSHLASLTNMNRLVNRLAERRRSEDAA